MEDIYAGHEHFLLENFAAAADRYSAAIRQAGACGSDTGVAFPSQPLLLEQKVKLYLHRAAAYLRLGKWNEVIEDCNQVLERDPSNTLAFHRKGTALLEKGEVDAARRCFVKGAAAQTASDDDGGAQFANWSQMIKRCEVATTRTTTCGNAAAATTCPSPNVPHSQSQAGGHHTKRRVKHEWSQTDSSVCLVLLVGGLRIEDCNVVLTADSISVSLQLPDGGGRQPFLFEVSPLFANVLPESRHVDVSKMKVEIKFLKAEQGVYWESLGGKLCPQQLESSTTVKVKNWEKACDAELEGGAEEGEEMLHKLFRDIYSKGDDSTRRAMKKSFQMSAGTVLSTNWSEVEGADYEKTLEAPHGQEVKRWNHT